MKKDDPRRLLELLTISDCGSITAAAEKLHISQPALSNSIALLERSLGVKVLSRNRRGVELTEYGEALIKHARSLDALLDRAQDEVRRRKLGLEGKLFIGVRPTAAVHLVPEAIRRLKHQSPDVAISVIEELDDKLERDLLAGEIDLTVGPVVTAPQSQEIEDELLIPDPFVLLMRTGHPLASSKQLSLSKLADIQWIMPMANTITWFHAETLFANAGVPWPETAISTNSLQVLKTTVERSDYVSIVSLQLAMAASRSGDCAYVSLDQEYAPQRFVGFRKARGRELSRSALYFIDHLRAAASDRRHTHIA